MNPILHHKWNAARAPDRQSSQEGPQVLPQEVAEHKVRLKQVGPIQGKN